MGLFRRFCLFRVVAGCPFEGGTKTTLLASFSPFFHLSSFVYLDRKALGVDHLSFKATDAVVVASARKEKAN
jgi:hypothetical protein